MTRGAVSIQQRLGGDALGRFFPSSTQHRLVRDLPPLGDARPRHDGGKVLDHEEAEEPSLPVFGRSFSFSA